MFFELRNTRTQRVKTFLFVFFLNGPSSDRLLSIDENNTNHELALAALQPQPAHPVPAGTGNNLNPIVRDVEENARLGHSLVTGIEAGDVHVQAQLNVLRTVYTRDQADHCLVATFLQGEVADIGGQHPSPQGARG